MNKQHKEHYEELCNKWSRGETNLSQHKEGKQILTLLEKVLVDRRLQRERGGVE